MVVKATEVTDLYKFPLGRCVFALQGVARRAKDVGATEVAELAGRNAVEARQAMDMAMRLRAGYSSQYPPEATAMDAVVDRCLGGVARYLDVQMRIYPDEPRGESAESLMRALFPDGVSAITHLPYAEEHAQVQSLLDRARSPDLIEHVRALPELPSLLERLQMRNDEYGELLRQSQDIPSRDEVRRAYDECQERIAETVALIIGLYALRTPGVTEERDHLLEPILEQNEALGALRRRQRGPVDVDPETGEEVPNGSTGDTNNDPTQAGTPDDAPVA